jgi:hypothetical protein
VLSHIERATPWNAPPCEAGAPALPPALDVDRALRRPIAQLIEGSAIFRAQCRRIVAATALVRVRLNPALDPTRMRARSIISRVKGGLLIVRVELSPAGSPIEWIAHEFEHIVEQLEGLPLRTLADQRAGVWRVGDELYETHRAVLAGRAARDQVLRRRTIRMDKNVE